MSAGFPEPNSRVTVAPDFDNPGDIRRDSCPTVSPMQASLRRSRSCHGHRRRTRSAAASGALLAGLALVAGACSSGEKHALPTSPTPPTSTATTAFATTTSSASTTTTTPVVTTTTAPVRVVDLGGCPADNPDTDLSRLNAETDVASDLVPIDALNVRICKYAPPGSRPHLLGISWLALSEASAFAADTNKLETNNPTSTTQSSASCSASAKESVSFLVTFAVDTQTVNLYAGGCPPTVSNGTLTAPATTQWYSDLAVCEPHGRHDDGTVRPAR